MTTDLFHDERRRLLLKVLGAAVGIVALGFGWRYTARAYRVRHERVALASLRACLFGPPLAPGEHPSGRIRRIELGNPPADWPHRCDKYAQDYAETDADLQGAGAFSSAPTSFDPDAIESVPYTFDAFFEAHQADRAAPAGVPIAPPALDVADERTPPLVHGGSLIGASFDRVPGADLHVLLDGGKLCSGRAPLDSMTCTTLKTPRMLDDHVLWPPSVDGGPTLASISIDQWSASTSPFERVDTGRAFCTKEGVLCAGFGQSDGAVLLVGRRTSGGDRAPSIYSALRTSDGDGAFVDLGLWLPFDVDPRLIGDRLLWVEPGAGGTSHLVSRRVTLGSPPVAPREDLGEVPPGERMGACFTRDALAVYGGGDGEERFVVFLRDGAPPSMQRFKPPKASTYEHHEAVACDEGVTFTNVEGQKPFAVRSVRCTAAGCGPVETIELEHVVPKRVAPTGHVRAVGLGDRLLLVWATEMRGLHYRVARPAEIERAPDHVLYDDRMSDGAPFTMSLLQDAAWLVARRDVAVLFIQTMGSTSGIKAFRFAADGSVRALH